jgi:hypothetical protein
VARAPPQPIVIISRSRARDASAAVAELLLDD